MRAAAGGGGQGEAGHTGDAQKATLTLPGGTAEFPVIPSVDGAPSIDVSTLTRKTGYTALDQGFVNTASTTSAG